MRQARERVWASVFSSQALASVISEFAVQCKPLPTRSICCCCVHVALSLGFASRKSKDFTPRALDCPPCHHLTNSYSRTPSPCAMSDHHFRCDSVWWLMTHRRKSEARAFGTHNLASDCTLATISFPFTVILCQTSLWLPGLTQSFPPVGLSSSSSPCLEVFPSLCLPL